jgi:hypothetical protein
MAADIVPTRLESFQSHQAPGNPSVSGKKVVSREFP